MPQDYSNIQTPDAIKDISFEKYFASMLADLKSLNTLINTIKESDPLYSGLQVVAYEIVSKGQEINDAVRAVMLLTSSGSDLDNLGVFYSEKRRVLSPGNPNANPPIPDILESDADYRNRLLVAFRALALGSADWYTKLVIQSGSPFEHLVKDMRVLGPEDNDDIDVVDPTDSSVTEIVPGQVWGYVESILTRNDDDTIANPGPIPSITLLTQVENYLDKNIFPDESLPRSQAVLKRFIGDTIKVRACIQKPYTIQATVTPLTGTVDADVRTAVENIALQFANDNQRIGQKIPLSAIYAALDTSDVFELTLHYPTSDVVPKMNELPIASGDFELSVTNYVVVARLSDFSSHRSSWSFLQDGNPRENNIIFTPDLTDEDLLNMRGVGIGRKFEIIDGENVVGTGQVSSELKISRGYYLFRLSSDIPRLSAGELIVRFKSAIDISLPVLA